MTSMCGILSSEGRLLGEDGGVNLGQPEEAIKAFQGCVDLAGVSYGVNEEAEIVAE
jgi:hypothetical protein